MFRLLAPAGTRLTPGQLWRTCVAGLPSNDGRPDPVSEVASSVGVSHAMGAGSGRAALYVVLKALNAIQPDRTIVAVPGYTCFSVPAAVVRAGLKVHAVDVDPLTLDFDREALDCAVRDRLLCIVATNLFGLMNDYNLMAMAARKAGAFIVDDAAQAFGSTMAGCHAGTRGDAGIYSMGRGKPLFGQSGGLIITQSDEIAEKVSNLLQACPETSKNSAQLLLELLAYYIFFNPRLYWIADSLPFLKLGVTVYDPTFPVERLGRAERTLLNEILESIEEFSAIRRRNAYALRESIGTKGRFTLLEPHPGCDPVFNRVPVLAEDERLRDLAVASLRRRGIGAARMYPTAICDIPGLRGHMAVEADHCPRAELVARNLLTLPTHSFLTMRDIQRIGEVFERC